MQAALAGAGVLFCCAPDLDRFAHDEPLDIVTRFAIRRTEDSSLSQAISSIADFRRDGGEIRNESSIFGPPRKRHDAWVEVHDWYKPYSGTAIPPANRFRRNTEADSPGHQMGFGVKRARFGHYRRRCRSVLTK